MAMPEISCEEFVGLVEQALGRLQRDWHEAREAAPEAYPERMSLGDWWEHVSWVVGPEVVLAGAFGFLAEPSAEGPVAA
jgi:hypothetical protein